MRNAEIKDQTRNTKHHYDFQSEIQNPQSTIEFLTPETYVLLRESVMKNIKLGSSPQKLVYLLLDLSSFFALQPIFPVI